MKGAHLAILEITIAGALLALGCGLVPGRRGASCRTTACTVWDHGVPTAGRCGAKKGDLKQCYCIAISGSKYSQEQDGCALPGSPS
ncbi:MAG: hypothetical protein ACRD13_12565 [Terriglobales bacterium]